MLYYNVEHLVGHKTFLHYIKGKYNHPVSEELVFMFIDMKDSTSIAEQMDSETFYAFINECFYYMTDATLKHKAEILKYIGDEVIFKWSKQDAFNNDNCVKLHFEIQAKLDDKASYFIEKYGVAPVFKSGIHGGECIGAFLGHLKKMVDYSGDTLNTTARIQGMCNVHSANLLISDYIYDRLDETTDYFKAKGDLELKGKQQKVKVYKWNNLLE